ncbi:SRPBCC family protein [Devosia sp. 2618]|uniref:SRPBCC family protein n=1 Tax=Devosia sp. 2618 TaxID=3156454 RepID=UPI003398B519
MSRRTDRASRLIEASPELIYRAMVSADALIKWLPPTGMTGEMLSFDARPGGHYRMSLRYDDTAITGKSGDNQDIVEAQLIDLVPNQRVTQAVDFESDDPDFAGTMTMHWVLTPAVGGTVVEIIAENVPEGISAKDHADGMTASLENLARLAAR